MHDFWLGLLMMKTAQSGMQHSEAEVKFGLYHSFK